MLKAMQTQNKLEQLVKDNLKPVYLEIENESSMHSGFFEGKESHFKVTVVSDQFESVRLVQRHQKIYQLVSELLTANDGNIHALALHTFTPTEWNENESSLKSPLCASKAK